MAMNPRLLRPTPTGFNPKTIANLANWWDAADSSTVTLNGTTVQSWSNKSSGPALAQGTAGAQPTYTAAGVNGRNVLTFDGGDVLAATATYSTLTTTVFMVVRENAAVSNAGLFSFHASSGNDQGNANAIFLEFSGNLELLRLERAIPRADFLGSGLLPLSVVSARGSNPGLLLRTNGVTRQNETGNTTSGTSTGILIGGRFQSGAVSASFRANMTLCEILHYTASLSDAQISRIERYLGQKWGITLAPQVANADAQDWVNRVYANGGSVSPSTATAVNTFCNDIDAAGIRDRFVRLNLFCGNSDASLNAVRTPLYRGPSRTGTQFGNATDTNLNFVAGDYVETGSTGGLKGNGTSKHLNTGLEQQAVALTNLHLSASCTDLETSFATTRSLMGIWDGAPSSFVNLRMAIISGDIQFLAGSFSPVGFSHTSSITHGLFVRSSATAAKAYFNGSPGNTNTANIGTPVTSARPYFIYAINNAGPPSQITAARFRLYSIGEAIGDSGALAFHNAVSAFNTTLGRT